MIKRYRHQKIETIWSDANKYRYWLNVELAVLRARETLGQIPEGTASSIASLVWMDEVIAEAINRRDERIRHDLNAFIEIVQVQIILGQEAACALFALEGDAFHEAMKETLARVSALAAEFHRKMTSYDTQEGATSLLLMFSCDAILEELSGLEAALEQCARQTRGVAMMFRTHVQDAQPGTFGIFSLTSLDLVRRRKKDLERIKQEIAVIKLSGAVGVFTLDPEVERLVGEELGLKPVISTQILPLDRKAEVMNALALIAADVEKIAYDLHFLASSAVGEVSEPFGKEQKGSSAMPHKKNPVALENITGVALVVRGYATMMMEAVTKDRLQRIISHSSVERIIIPDGFGYLAYVLKRFTGVVQGVVIFAERMWENIQSTRGTYASQEVASLLIEKGMAAETAYRTVQSASAVALRERRHLKEVLCSEAYLDASAILALAETELDQCFDVKEWLRHESFIFAREGVPEIS